MTRWRQDDTLAYRFSCLGLGDDRAAADRDGQLVGHGGAPLRGDSSGRIPSTGSIGRRTVWCLGAAEGLTWRQERRDPAGSGSGNRRRAASACGCSLCAQIAPSAWWTGRRRASSRRASWRTVMTRRCRDDTLA